MNARCMSFALLWLIYECTKVAAALLSHKFKFPVLLCMIVSCAAGVEQRLVSAVGVQHPLQFRSVCIHSTLMYSSIDDTLQYATHSVVVQLHRLCVTRMTFASVSFASDMTPLKDAMQPLAVSCRGCMQHTQQLCGITHCHSVALAILH
jgi:hypothetical protein